MNEATSSPLSFETRGAVRYLQAVRQHWLLVLLVTAATVLAALLFIAVTPTRYEATADIVVMPISVNDENLRGLNLFTQSLSGSSVVVTASRVFESPVIERRAERADPAVGKATIVVQPLSQAEIVSITASAGTAAGAARAANTYALTAVAVRSEQFQQELQTRIRQLSAQIARIPRSQRSGNFEFAALQGQLGILRGFVGANDPTVRVLTPATRPDAPSWPKPVLTIAAAVIVGLLLGIAIAVALEIGSPRLASEEELVLGHRLPVLARLPRAPRRVIEQFVVGQGNLPSSVWKGYRTLRAALATTGPEGRFPQSILITSASPGDAKTMTSVGLAVTLATTGGMRVALVDADVHRSMIATIFNVPTAQRRGLLESLSGVASADTALVPAPSHRNLFLLLSRPDSHTRVDLLTEARIERLLEQLLDVVDVVVIDSPPVPEVAEVVEVAVAVDVTVIAARLRHTRRDKLAQTREMLSRRGVSPAGFVLTTRESSDQDQGEYYDHPTRAAAPEDEVVAPPARAGREPTALPARPTPVRIANSPPTLGSAPADEGRRAARSARAQAGSGRVEDDPAV
jgi:capsular exopolysaccharide synthesis family protein